MAIIQNTTIILRLLQSHGMERKKQQNPYSMFVVPVSTTKNLKSKRSPFCFSF